MRKYEDYLFKQLERAADRFSINESDQPDTITMDIPLLTRVLELVREDIKDDVELHHIVDRLIKIKNQGPLTMDHYSFIAGTKEFENKLAAQDDSTEVDDIKKLAGI